MAGETKTILETSEEEATDENAPSIRIPCLLTIGGSYMGKIFPLAEKELIIGRGLQAQITLLDSMASRNHAKITNLNGQVQITDLGSTNGTFVNNRAISEQALSEGDKVQIGNNVFKFTYQDSVDKEYHEVMYGLAVTDGLTNIYNKKYFMERIKSEFSHAVRHNHFLSLLLFDIDHFKNINDTYGHQTGDYILQRMARWISQTIRQEDVFARFGGEEFVILLRDSDPGQSYAFGERIRRLVEDSPFEFEGNKPKVTISIGIATLKDSSYNTPENMIEASDQYLYQAKKSGRNQVCSQFKG